MRGRRPLYCSPSLPTAETVAGQVSLEALLIWAALIAVMGLILPSVSALLEAYSLSSHVHAFDSFARGMDHSLVQSAFAAPGSRIRVPVPAFEGLSAEILHDTLYLDFDHPRFSARKTREIHSPVPLVGTFVPRAREWIILRTESGIVIQSGS